MKRSEITYPEINSISQEDCPEGQHLVMEPNEEEVDLVNSPTTFILTPAIDLDEIIDVSKINFGDDEVWLYECSNSSADLERIINNNQENGVDTLLSEVNFQPHLTKNIDTRTFTRPKKRYTRPSIEKYNEELYGNDISSSLVDSGIHMNGLQDTNTPNKPVQFDLTQPMSGSYYFESVVANAAIADSFQNMSPPSLVNSMCSSTFANLMENSFIKNDPVLREIRDTDFIGLVLQQESEPMLQSTTNSCCSSSSDLLANLNKTTCDDNGLDHNNTTSATLVGDGSIPKENNSEPGTTVIMDYCDEFDLGKTITSDCLNDTFNKVKNNTFNMAQDVNKTSTIANNTFHRRKNNIMSVLNNETKTYQDINATVTIDSKKLNNKLDGTENLNRLLNRRGSPALDRNRQNYADKNEKLNKTFSNDGSKRHSIESSDSTDNLDYMSLSSGSSKGSNKILSMDALNTIVDMQEKSLHVMSTPKPRIGTENLWSSEEISPISGRSSDPELSSGGKTTVKSVITQNSIKKQRSIGQLYSKIIQPKRMDTINKMPAAKNSFRGSHPNLKQQGLRRPSNLNSMGHTLKGSYTSLKPMSKNLPVAPPPLTCEKGSYTVLEPINTHLPVAPPPLNTKKGPHTITQHLNSNSPGSSPPLLSTQGSFTVLKPSNPNLPVAPSPLSSTKGSYTILKPVNSNLPVAPPPLNSTITIAKQPNNAHTSGPAVTKNNKAQFIKPQLLKTSGLPRPLTGIPRPVSRIPGPLNARSGSKSAGQGRH